MGIKIIYTFLFALIAFSKAAEYSRDESKEETKTQFNLASTLTGDITNTRHRARANIGSQLFPYGNVVQQLQPQTPPYSSLQHTGNSFEPTEIDEPHGHERNEGGVGIINVRAKPPVPAKSPMPAFQSAPARPDNTVPISYPSGAPLQPVPYPMPTPNQPLPGAGIYATGTPFQTYPAQNPVLVGYPYTNMQYPGQYLPQYPVYPQPAQFPAYIGSGPAQPGSVPVVVQPLNPEAVPGPVPAMSYQNHNQFPSHSARDPEHWDHTFKMTTQYKEDGVHKGPFQELNNHNAFGYGSGYGGGYNGAFNSPNF